MLGYLMIGAASIIFTGTIFVGVDSYARTLARKNGK